MVRMLRCGNSNTAVNTDATSLRWGNPLITSFKTVIHGFTHLITALNEAAASNIHPKTLLSSGLYPNHQFLNKTRPNNVL